MTGPWRNRSNLADAMFVAKACEWMRDPTHKLLGFVWAGYDSMRRECPPIDTRDLERSITQLLEPRVRDAMTGFEPFYVQKECYEHETMAAAPAQPPAYDLAFVFRNDERIKWPLEAKVLETPRTLSEYVADVRNEFLTCRYAPFSSSGAMVAYLLSGDSKDALKNISEKLSAPMIDPEDFDDRPHKLSEHQRQVPRGKSYPRNFTCHHLIFDYTGLARAKVDVQECSSGRT